MSQYLEPGGSHRGNVRRLKRFSNTVAELDEQLGLDGPMERSPRRRSSSRSTVLPSHVPRSIHSMMDDTAEDSTLDVVVDLSEEPSSFLPLVEERATPHRELDGCVFFPLLSSSRGGCVWSKELQRKIRQGGGECRTTPTSDVTHIITDLRRKNDVEKALSKCQSASMRSESSTSQMRSGGGGGWVRALVRPDGGISSHVDLENIHKKRGREGSDLIQHDEVWSGKVMLVAPTWIRETLKRSPTADGFVLSFREEALSSTSERSSMSVAVESMVERLASAECRKESKNAKPERAKMASYACSKTWTLQEGRTIKQGANAIIMEKLGELKDLYEMLGDQLYAPLYQPLFVESCPTSTHTNLNG
jgi:hypothetical protein